MRPKIAYIISQYPAINHTFMLREARQMAAAGWDLGRFSIRQPDRPADKLAPEELDELRRTRYVKTAGVPEILRTHLSTFASRPFRYLSVLWWILWKGHRDLRSILQRGFYFGEAVVLGRWLTEGGYGHVHSHYSPLVAMLIGRLFPITYSMTVHGPDEFLDPKGSLLAEKISGSLFTVAISFFARSQMMMHSAAADWAKIHPCYLGVPEPARVQPKSDPPESAPLRFLCVGRLAPVKGQHILVEAAHRLAATGRDFVITIAGGGPELKFLRNRVEQLGLSSRVLIPGFVSQEELDRLYAEADVFVLPSFAEGLPGVLMEAMSAGTPCVTTYVNGVPELVEDGRTGLLVTPADENGLAAAMERMIVDSDLRRELGENGRRQVREKFDLARNVEKLSGIFESYLIERG